MRANELNPALAENPPTRRAQRESMNKRTKRGNVVCIKILREGDHKMCTHTLLVPLEVYRLRWSTFFFDFRFFFGGEGGVRRGRKVRVFGSFLSRVQRGFHFSFIYLPIVPMEEEETSAKTNQPSASQLQTSSDQAIWQEPKLTP